MSNPVSSTPTEGWRPIIAEIPLPGPRPSLVWNDEHDVLYMPLWDEDAEEDEGVTLIWRWTGETWEKETRLFPDHYGACFAAYHPGEKDFYFFQHYSEGELSLALSSNFAGTRRITGLEDNPDLALAYFDDSAGEIRLFADDRLFRLTGDTLEFITETPELSCVVFDAHRSLLLGIDNFGALHAYDNAWRKITGKCGSNISPIYHPGRREVITLKSTEGNTFNLARLTDEGFVEEPNTHLPRFLNRASLGIYKEQLIAIGGEDLNGAVSPGPTPWISRAGAPFEPQWNKIHLHADSYLTLTAGKYLYALTHTGCAVHRRRGHEWKLLVSGEDYVESETGESWGRLDGPNLNLTCSEDTVFCLDNDGNLQTAPLPAQERGYANANDVFESSWQRVSTDEGPGSHRAKRTAMAYDRLHGRLVVHGGSGNNDTWIFSDGSWEQLPSEKLPRGIGSMVDTPEGIHLLKAKRLWRLKENRWVQLAEVKTGRDDYLLYDSKRNCLLVAGNRTGIAVLTFDESDSPAELHGIIAPPTGASLSVEGSPGFEIALDPVSDELVFAGSRGQYVVVLESLNPPAKASLPGREMEQEAPPSRTAPAGSGAKLPLFKLAFREGPQVPGSIPRVGLNAPGMTRENWPHYEERPMFHVLTLPRELISANLPEHVAAVAIFLSSWEENEAFEPNTDEAAVRFLSAEDLALGEFDFLENFAEELDHELLEEAHELPAGEIIAVGEEYVFEDVREPNINGEIVEAGAPTAERSSAVRRFLGDRLRSRTNDLNTGGLSAPDVLWIQGVETPSDQRVIFQFDEQLCPGLNLGDAGMLYVSANEDCTEGAAWWQCH